MNVSALLIVVVAIVACAAVAMFGIARVTRWLWDRNADHQAIEIQRLAQEREQRERELALKERELAFKERVEERVAPSLELPTITEYPAEIVTMVSDESEDWAREDALKLVGEAYLDAGGNWEKAGSQIAHRYAAAPESRLPQQLLGWNRMGRMS